MTDDGFDSSKFKDSPRQMKFIEDMEDAGFELRCYTPRGMGSKECPAVSCGRDKLHVVIRATDVDLGQDALGKGYILYAR